MVDQRTSELFQRLTNDVEWQNGLTPAQRDVAMTFGQAWIIEAIQTDANADLACEQVREALRHLTNLIAHHRNICAYRTSAP